MEGDRVGREVADDDVEDLVDGVLGEPAQARLFEDQFAVDDEGEELAEDEHEVEVLDLILSRRSARQQSSKPLRLLGEQRDVRHGGELFVRRAPVRELDLAEAAGRPLAEEELVVRRGRRAGAPARGRPG